MPIHRVNARRNFLTAALIFLVFLATLLHAFLNFRQFEQIAKLNLTSLEWMNHALNTFDMSSAGKYQFDIEQKFYEDDLLILNNRSRAFLGKQAATRGDFDAANVFWGTEWSSSEAYILASWILVQGLELEKYDKESAQTLYRLGLGLPTNRVTPEIYYRLATCQRDENQFESAISSYQHVYALAGKSPLSADAHYWVGRLLIELGEKEKAARELLISVELAPDDYWNSMMLSRTLCELGSVEVARKYYDTARAPENVSKESFFCP